MEIVLLWCFVLAWMAKRGAEDLVHAVKGTPNPRYEVKKAKARAAGQPVKGQPRYATKEWAADLLSDALVAHTEKRRTKAKAKAQPVDDMIGILREPKAQPKPERVYDPNYSRTCPDCKGEVALDGRPCPRCLAEQQHRNALWDEEREAEQRVGPRTPHSPEDREAALRNPSAATQREEKPMRKDDDEDDRLTGDAVIAGLLRLFPATQCPRCTKFIRVGADGKPKCWCPSTNTPTADETLAQVIQFPNIKNIEKEITMPNSEATGLTTAIAFADAAADAHQTFSTAGSEGYAGALEAMGFGEGIKGLAAEAREASATATAKWAALSAAMTEFMQGREFYANNPDAPEKAALVNE